MLHRRASAALALGAAVLLLAGCGGQDEWTAKRPKVVPTTGTVLYKGKPVEDATVTFTNAAASRSGYAKTGADGRFTLTTFVNGDGVVPGKQQVSVHKVKAVEQKPVDVSGSNEVPPTPEEHWLIPKRYGNPNTSGLTFEVSADGKNDFVIELKD